MMYTKLSSTTIYYAGSDDHFIRYRERACSKVDWATLPCYWYKIPRRHVEIDRRALVSNRDEGHNVGQRLNA